jgi:hypothetical protein
MVLRKWRNALPAIRQTKVCAMNHLLPLHTGNHTEVRL